MSEPCGRGPDRTDDRRRTSRRRGGKLPWAHVTALVDDVVTVSEESIVSAMGWLAANARIVVEPSGELATAAVLEHRHRLGSGTTVAVVTGGNIDLQSFASPVGGQATVD